MQQPEPDGAAKTQLPRLTALQEGQEVAGTPGTSVFDTKNVSIGVRGSFTGQAVLDMGQVGAVIEAGIRSGDREMAIAALEALAPLAEASGTHVALGLLARGRALLADDDQAEAEYRQSIEHLRQTRAVPQQARSRPLYGEWLRRQRRRRDAREQLQAAWQMFDTLGMEAFAARPGRVAGHR